jgi:hypothetical protein
MNWVQGKTAFVVALAAAVVAVVGGLLSGGVRPPLRVDATAWSLCSSRYQRASTLADTLIIDQQRPVMSRGQATVAVTCRVLRESRAQSVRRPTR